MSDKPQVSILIRVSPEGEVYVKVDTDDPHTVVIDPDKRRQAPPT